MGDIHIKIEDSWFERWLRCSKFRGQRSYLVQQYIKKLIVVLESQKEMPFEIKINLTNEERIQDGPGTSKTP